MDSTDLLRRALRRLRRRPDRAGVAGPDLRPDADAAGEPAAGAYTAEFAAAAALAASLGHPPEPAVGQPTRAAGGGFAPASVDPRLEGPRLENSRLDAVQRVVADVIGPCDLHREVALRCVWWTRVLAPRVAAALGCPAYPTLGYASHPALGDIFACTAADAARWLREGPGDAPGRWHSWLTLAGGEILDVTLFTSLTSQLASADDFATYFGRVAYGPPGDWAPWRWHPVVVGTPYLTAVLRLAGPG